MIHRMLQKAMERKLKIQMIYMNADHQFTQRWVYVLAVDQQYVRCYCLLRKGIRSFQFEQILSVSEMGHKSAVSINPNYRKKVKWINHVKQYP
ncbi:hypothetical protein IC620_03705 [Hazenella sp. IB182357]|uniref:WYL domain-containing protein n=1 Tax=Polycladospora coralii TaxID=2771432 RepID=A0A926RTQ5_9BACL|nr:hypothetical protein [Polycladospora coralii]MBD1371459.1 hypothetical protein [Polycladospora coralii]